MFKLFVASTLLFVSTFSLQASKSLDDQQTMMIEQLTKKLQCAQAAGKSNQLILDEMLAEVAAQVDETKDAVTDETKKKQPVFALEIVCVVAAISFGLWCLYDSYKNYQQEKKVSGPSNTVNHSGDPLFSYNSGIPSGHGQPGAIYNNFLNNHIAADDRERFDEVVRGLPENQAQAFNTQLMNIDYAQRAGEQPRVVGHEIQQVILEFPLGNEFVQHMRN